MNMAENNAEVKENSTKGKGIGIVREIARPLGYEAYKESKEAGKGSVQSIINGLLSAFMPATYSMVEKNKADQKENPNADKGTFAKWLGYTGAFVSDFWNDVMAIAFPNGPFYRYFYGQFTTRIYGK